MHPARAAMGVAAGVLGLSLHIFAAPAWSADRTLTLGYVESPGTVYEDVVKAIPDAIADRTGDALTIKLRPFPSSGEAFQRLTVGEIEMAALFPAFAELRGLNFAAVPGVLDDLDAYRRALQELLRPAFDKVAEAAGLRFLATGALSGLAVFTDATVTAEGGLKGSRIGVSSPLNAPVLAAVDVQVVRRPTPEMYIALQARALDGALVQTWRAERFRLQEVAKTAVDWPYGRLTPWVVVAKAAAWDGLDEPARDAAESALRDLEESAFGAAVEAEFIVRRRLRELGLTFAGLSVEQLRSDAVVTALRDVQQQWMRGTSEPEWFNALIVEAAAYGSGGGACPDNFKRCGDLGCQVACE